MTEVGLSLRIDVATHVAASLRGHAGALRNSKHRPRGMTHGQVLDRILAAEQVAEALESEVAKHDVEAAAAELDGQEALPL